MSEAVTVWECAACGHVVYPPRLLCPRCASSDWRTLSTAGGVASEVTIRYPPLEHGRETRLAAIDSDAGVRVIARLEGEAEPGQRVALSTEGLKAIATPSRGRQNPGDQEVPR